jgi:hypothetical protein
MLIACSHRRLNELPIHLGDGPHKRPISRGGEVERPCMAVIGKRQQREGRLCGGEFCRVRRFVHLHEVVNGKGQRLPRPWEAPARWLEPVHFHGHRAAASPSPVRMQLCAALGARQRFVITRRLQ